MPASKTTIASFPTSTGGGNDPDGQLFMDSNGDLLGATVHGGANGIGTTYEIAKIAGGYATTPTFLADIPLGLNTLVGVQNLSADANGDLFGLMFSGGANHFGTVVEFPAGGGAPNTALATFAGGAGGSNPGGRLLVDASGNLFGTTLSGGVNNAGTVYELQKTGNSYATAPTVLTSFTAGVTPSGSGNMVEDAAGNLFGTTTNSVFEVKKTGASYAAPVDLVPAFPIGTQIGSLTMDTQGDIFGTTISGAANDLGSVFEIKKIGAGYAGAATTLASFAAADGKLALNRPKTLILDANGDLFGTTDPSSGNSGGVVYELVNTGGSYNSTPTIVFNFNGLADGSLGANLVADANGNLFGTTQAGGANNIGSAFEITGSGFAVLPALTAGANASYTAGTAAVALDPGLSITGPSLTGATISIGAGFRAGDALSVGSPQGGIISSYNAGTGVLTLSGAATRAAYQAELESVTFASANTLNPSSRTISWSVTDGANQAAAASSVAVFVSNPDLNITLQKSVGQVALWQVSGATPTLSASALLGPDPGPSWFAQGSGAFFSGDTSDTLLQNTDGRVALWQIHNNAFVSSSTVANPGPSWQIDGVGEFNGGGQADALLQNADGRVAVWEMNGAQITQSGVVSNPGPSWNVEATGDFTNDGKSDIVLQNDDGRVAIWNMNGDQVTQSTVGANPGTSWHVVGTGDFDNNGHTDILLQNSSGAVAIWDMNGDQLTQSTLVSNPGSAWHAVGTGDFNSDGKTAITLQNNNGAVAVWDMNGSTIGQSGLVANPGPAWSLVGNGHHIG